MTRYRLNAFLLVPFLLPLATMGCSDASDENPAPSTDSESTGSTPTEDGSCDEGSKLCSLPSIDQSWCCDTDLACGESHNRCVAVYGTTGCEGDEIECVRPGLDDGLIQYMCCQADQLCTADGCEDPPPATLHDSTTEDQCDYFDYGMWCIGPT